MVRAIGNKQNKELELMIVTFFRLITLFSCLFVNGCQSSIILKPTNDVVSVSPISVSIGGDKLRISKLDITKVSENYEIEKDIIEKLGIKPVSYDKESIFEVITNLNTGFEIRYLDFYRTIVHPAFKEGLTELDSKTYARIVDIVNKKFRIQISKLLVKFRSEDARKIFEAVLDKFQENSSKTSSQIDSRSELFSQLSSIQLLVSRIARDKDSLKRWLTAKVLNYKFAKSLRITIDIASQNGNPLLTAKRAYAYINSEFENESRQPSKISFVEVGRQCRNQLIACRIEFVHILDDDSSSRLLKTLTIALTNFNEQSSLEIAKSQQSLNEPENYSKQYAGDGKRHLFREYFQQINSDLRNTLINIIKLDARSMLDSLSFNMEILVNGREAYILLPGRYMNITVWDEYK